MCTAAAARAMAGRAILRHCGSAMARSRLRVLSQRLLKGAGPMPRWQFVAGAVMAALLAARATDGQAQGFPSRPITIVVQFPAGATADTLTRMVADKLHDTLGAQIVVENRTGA